MAVAVSRELLSREVVEPRLPNISMVAGNNRVLPTHIDDLTASVRFDIYEQMMLDPMVQSCMGIYITGLLAGDIDLLPVKKFGEPGYDTDTAVVEFCKDVLWNLQSPFKTEVLPDLLWAKGVGHRIAEKVYYPVAESPKSGKVVLKYMKVAPRNLLKFVVDPEHGNVIGITDGVFNQDGKPQTFPREKFAVMTWKPVNSDPRGSSDLRSAYTAWWYKQQVLPVLMKFLALHGTPALIAKLPPGAWRKPIVNNQTGTPTLDDQGNATYKALSTQILSSLEAFENSKAMTVPNGTDIEMLEARSNGDIFSRVFEMFDVWIAKAILYQSPSENFQGTAGTTHQEFLGLSYSFGKNVLEHFIRKEILSDLVRYNFGEGTRIPRVKVQGTEYYDFLAKASAIAKLLQVNGLHPAQLNPIYADMNLPELTPAQMAEMLEWHKTAMEPQQTAMDNGGLTSG